MSTPKILRPAALLALLLAGSLAGARDAHAHCDGLDGPVVAAGRAALESGDVTPALAWVLPAGEGEVRGAFEQAVRVRGLGEEARALADRFFFETLVRVHREGEGEPYTGLKPAGRDLGPAIPAADRALESGSPAAVEALLTEAVRHGVRERFHAAHAARAFAPGDVEGGRAYVAAYVSYLHYVEGLYGSAAGTAHGHDAAEDAAARDTRAPH